MSSRLPSFDLVEDSTEVYLNSAARPGRAIYLAIVTLVLVSTAALPVVRVGVSIQAEGVIRPATEKHEVLAATSGYVERVGTAAFAQVRSGEELFRLRGESAEARRELARSRLAEVIEATKELEWFLGDSAESGLPGAPPNPRSRHSAERELLDRELARLETTAVQAGDELARTAALARLGLASRAEEDRLRQDAEALAEEKRLIVQRYRSGWQARIEELHAERLGLLDQLSALAGDSLLRVIPAPVGGTVEEIASVSTGSFVHEGQRLAVISPSAEMVAEVYLTPRDIGLVDPDLPVRLLIDAFPYRDWGHLTGRVAEISSDFVPLGERPVFRALVRLDDTGLTLPNGLRREIRKGMTLRARFMVAERSLWQLIRDDVNDWLNPFERHE